MLQIDITPISGFLLVFGLGYLLALAYVILLDRRRSGDEGSATQHVFSLIVPARNEAAVIGECINSLLSLDYPAEQYEVLVVDDNSEDCTAAIANLLAESNPGRVLVLPVTPERSARGKGSALNHGFSYLLHRSRYRNDLNWIVGVFDADGLPESNMLKKASFQFLATTVGGVQSSVRIRNRTVSWLTRMQDIEFAGFSRVTQLIRMRITSSASLGGNGQFVRASALQEVAIARKRGLYWNPRALTEDLELSARLAVHNWDLHHLNTSCVWQEGIENSRALFRQRTRWAWGSMQVFAEYVLRMKAVRTRHVQFRKRVDLLFNLSMFLVSPLVLLTWMISGFALVGLVGVLTSFPGPVLFLLSFAYLPLVGYGLVTARGYRTIRIPLDLVSFAVYTYHWIPCLYAALWHMIARHGPVWWKTPRAHGEPAG